MLQQTNKAALKNPASTSPSKAVTSLMTHALRNSLEESKPRLSASEFQERTEELFQLEYARLSAQPSSARLSETSRRAWARNFSRV